MKNFLVLLRQHPWLFAGIAVAICAVLYFTLGDSVPVAIGYRTADVTRGELIVKVSATGNVQPTNQVDVGSELSGTVASVLVDENDKVNKGDVLARLDTTKLENQVARLNAGLRAAEAGVQQAEATQREARANLDRLKKVQELSAGKAPSASDMEVAESSLARSVANVVAAHAAVEQARAELHSASTDLGKGTIRSPINGVVLVRKIEPGQTVAASLQAPVLFTLAEDLTRMELDVDIDEADVGAVRAGQDATFTVDAWPDREYPAKLVRIGYGAQSSAGVVSYKATLTVDNRDLSLRPGMTATASIVTAARKNVLLVPNGALRFVPPETATAGSTNKSGNSFVSKLLPRPPMPTRPKKVGTTNKGHQQQVYVLENGMPVAVPVSTGATDGQMTEIIAGELADNAAVVIEYTEATP